MNPNWEMDGYGGLEWIIIQSRTNWLIPLPILVHSIKLEATPVVKHGLLENKGYTFWMCWENHIYSAQSMNSSFLLPQIGVS